MAAVFAAATALRQTHVALAWLVVVTNGLAGAWALAADRLPGLRRKELWWLTGFAQVAVFVQVVIGVTLRSREMAGRNMDHLQFHMLYGFTAAFTVAIIYSYRAQLKPHLYRLYGFGGLWLMGLALRAIFINPV